MSWKGAGGEVWRGDTTRERHPLKWTGREVVIAGTLLAKLAWKVRGRGSARRITIVTVLLWAREETERKRGG